MIDLSIAMKLLVIVVLLIFVFVPRPVEAQQETQAVISSPLDGQIVQGLVTVTGTVTVLGYASYELSFAYDNDPTQTWFVLTNSSQPVFEGELGTWDTTTLTDGDYTLRLRVSLLDGSVQETTVSGLRVRNYTAVPTTTFTPTSTAVVQFAPPTAQQIAPAPATATPSLPTPTPFPPNPASLQEASISTALGRGAVLALLLFGVFGLLLRLRRE
jgi:hypothetical protein